MNKPLCIPLQVFLKQVEAVWEGYGLGAEVSVSHACCALWPSLESDPTAAGPWLSNSYLETLSLHEVSSVKAHDTSKTEVPGSHEARTLLLPAFLSLL